MALAVEVPLSWSKSDIEQRLGFRGARYTRVNTWLSFLIACLLTAAFYAALLPLRHTHFAAMFFERGPTPYFICGLSAWALVILWLKSRKLALQRRALDFDVVPAEADFVLSSATVDDCLQRIYLTVDDPKHFLLFNRIVIALSNLRNLGRVSDVDDILRSQAELEESSMETSYSTLQGFIWAIPVLGFIGTVLGLSAAIGAFGNVLAAASDVSQIASSLQGVTAGLNTAFETTLVALVAALFIQLRLTFLKKGEEEFLDACSEYCLRQVVNRLRIMPFEKQAD
ncbi:MAG: MotA/TolQ/ExbB proton channel family protein [Pirellulales bacterium]